jgi:signal transduction histidine kinase
MMVGSNMFGAAVAVEPSAYGECPVGQRVYFYDGDAGLVQGAAGFLASGLMAGQPAVAIATKVHADAFLSRLAALGINGDEAAADGRLRVVDAHALLERLLVDGAPDRARFDAHVGDVLEKGAGGGAVVVYSEVADLLWRHGLEAAALAMAHMWGELGSLRRTSVLHAYRMAASRGVRARGRSGVLALDADMRERQPTEEALLQRLAEERRAAAELRHRNDELQKRLDSVVEEGRAKDDFIAMLGHEIRGPLASICWALQLMQSHGDHATTNERTIIGRQVGNLVRLVDDLHDASRIAAGKLEVRCERVDMADVISMAVETAAPLVTARKHALHLHVSKRSAFVHGDPLRLAQALSNLLSNAAKYTKQGGCVSLRLERRHEQVVICVRDTGIGVEAELLPRIFERGVQGKPGVGGLGLGLTIVRAIVESHGGTITAHSEGPGRGSEFRVTLPAAEPPAPDEPAADAEPEPPPSGLPGR